MPCVEQRVAFLLQTPEEDGADEDDEGEDDDGRGSVCSECGLLVKGKAQMRNHLMHVHGKTKG